MFGEMNNNGIGERIALDFIMSEANDVMIQQVKDGELTLKDDKERELLVTWLRANLSKSDKMLSILEAWAILLYEDDMEREYIVQFINRVREMSNSITNTW